MVDRMVWFLSTSTLLVLLFIYPTRVSGSCAHACWGMARAALTMPVIASTGG